VSKRWGLLPLDEPEPIPAGDGWKAMPGQPKACSGCGERVKLNAGEPIWFACSEPRATWHFRCRPRRST
jgi:hypothetical protein